MATPAQLIRRLIVAQGLALDTGVAGDWRSFTAFLPDEINNAVVVYDTVGKIDGRLMGSGIQIEKPGIQVMVRGVSYPDAWKKSQDIATMLDLNASGTSVAITGDGIYSIQNVSRTGTILSLGPEEVGTLRRYSFTINAIMTYRKM